jgi:hypothetical protein
MKLEAVYPDLPMMVDVINRVPHGIAILDTKRYRLPAMNQKLEYMTGFRIDEVRGDILRSPNATCL